MCLARFLNCFHMRDASATNRVVCTIFTYALTFLPFIFVLVWVQSGMLSYAQSGVDLRGLAMDFGPRINGTDPATGLETWAYPEKWRVFNWHPLLMVTSFATLYTQAALHFRLLPFGHELNKLIHMITQTLAVILSTIAIGVIVKFKEHFQGANQFYNPHGWIGITVWSFFVLQWVHGLVYFYTPAADHTSRKAYKPYHMWAGLWIYVGTCMAIVSGLAGYSWIFDGVDLPSTQPYHWACFIAMSVLVCAGCVAYHFMPTGLPPDAGGGLQLQHTGGSVGTDERSNMFPGTPHKNYTALNPPATNPNSNPA